MVMSGQRFQVLGPLLGGGLIATRRPRERRVEMVLGMLELSGRGPEQRLDLRRSHDPRRRIAGVDASLQLANPIPTSAYRQLGIALQPPREDVLVEIRVVEGIEVRRQSPHRPDELKLPGDAVAGETEAHFTREFEPLLCLPLDLAERISGGETVRDQVDACIRRVREVAGILRCLEGAPQEGATDPQVLGPVGHVDGKDQVHAGAETVEPMLFHQVEPEPAEAKPGLVVPEVRPQHAAQPRISEARSVAVAVLQAEGRHPTDDEAEKIQVREQGRRGEDREHVHGRTPVRIAHQRQIEQRLDRARVEPLPQVVIFLPDVIRRRTQRPLAVDPLQVIAPHRDGAVAQVQRRIEIDAHASDGRRVDDGLCASRQHGEVLSRQRQLPGQILALRLVELEFEHEPVAFFPSALRQQGVQLRWAETRPVRQHDGAPLHHRCPAQPAPAGDQVLHRSLNLGKG